MKLATIVEGVQNLAARLNELRPAMAAAAQAIYDAWDPEYDEFGDAEVGGGGICDQIAQAIGEILTDANIDYTEGGHEGDDHAYLIAYDDQNSYLVDIPYSHYESGGGMSWTRHPDVTFTPDMIEIHETHRPDWIDGYEGLEDADEFEHPTKGEMLRRWAENEGMPIQELPASPFDPEDIRGIPRINESYEGLEDDDQFRETGDCDEGCDDCGAMNAGQCATCEGCYCQEHMLNHQRRDIIASRISTNDPFVSPSGEVVDLRSGGRLGSLPAGVHNDMFTLFRLVPCEGGAPLAESYEGLEDADEFAENEHDFCDGCTNDFHWEDLDSCNSCDSVWCDHCVSKGSMFDWVPEQLEDGSDTHPDAGMMIACPRCMPDDYVSPYPADQYGEGTLEHSGESPWHPRPPIPPGYVQESYEGLEDDDQFRDDDFCWCGNELDPGQGDLIWQPTEQCQECGVYLCPDCVDQGLIHGRTVFCPDCAKTVTESYEGLEDEDSFRFNDDHCMHCGREFNLRNRIVGYECSVHGCNNYTCQHCMTPNGWDYDYATDTGSVAICPECLATYDIS